MTSYRSYIGVALLCSLSYFQTEANMYEEGTYTCFRIDIKQLYKYYCPIINNFYRIYLSYISHVHVSSTNDWEKNSSFFEGGGGGLDMV